MKELEKTIRPTEPSSFLDPVRKAKMKQGRVKMRDGRKIAYLSCPGQGDPLVILHGLLDSKDSCNRLGLVNNTRRPVIAFDLPGFGGSDAPNHSRVSHYGDDILAALDELAVLEFHLLGHSLGGAIATSIADRQGDQVLSLNLLTPAGFGTLFQADLFALPGLRSLAPHAVMRASSHQKILAAVYRASVVHNQVPDEPLLRKLSQSVHDGAHGLGPALLALHASGHSKGAFFRRQINYHGPARALFGEKDRLVPKSHIKGLLRAMPQAEVEIWMNVGHHPQYERTRATAAWVHAGLDEKKLDEFLTGELKAT
jgi:pyruvate dehydrogenase E2 component (dihydrolipoamide acetyltransferase)